jgi:hypothetical protein
MPDPDPAGASGNRAPDVESLTSAILQRWRQHLRRHSDDRPRTGDRGESERLLVGALLRASSSKDDALLPGLAAAAAQYGAGQQRDKLDPGSLCDELSCLRQIVWSELKSDQSNVNEAIDRILRFDRALSIVVKAAVRAGYAEKGFSSEPPSTEHDRGDNEPSAHAKPNDQ